MFYLKLALLIVGIASIETGICMASVPCGLIAWGVMMFCLLYGITLAEARGSR